MKSTEMPHPVVVDLDETLSRTDTLHEQVVLAVLSRPWSALRMLPALFRSRAALKAHLSRLAPSSTPLCLNEDVLNAVSTGRAPVVVCTAANEESARRLCRGLEFVREIRGSDATSNLKGQKKAEYLVQRFGELGFDYYGDSRADLEVWKHAAKAFVVTDDRELVARAREVCSDVVHIPVNRPPFLLSCLRVLRPHQWLKNLLVIVPVLTSHRFTEIAVVKIGLAAVGVFCLLSSAVYVVNDVLDLHADRLHPTKRNRPFASGALSLLAAPPLFLVLALTGVWLAFRIGAAFGLASLGYLAVALGYSAFLKRVTLLDVFTLSGLYTVRLFAGGSATGIPISVWLAAFSLFIFLSLALCKRYVEVLDFSESGDSRLPRRGYRVSDAGFILGQGLMYMGCSTLVLAIYLSSSAVSLLYTTPAVLWFAVWIVAFWGGRLWLLANRRALHDDPVWFAVKDGVSWICLALLTAVFFAAMTL